jgi:RHS repeat-associated protein
MSNPQNGTVLLPPAVAAQYGGNGSDWMIFSYHNGQSDKMTFMLSNTTSGPTFTPDGNVSSNGQFPTTSPFSISNNAGDYSDTYTYDLEGNRLTKTHVTSSGTETTTNTYDLDDQLTQSVDSVNGTTTYHYDNNGSQTQTVAVSNSGTVTTNYHYDLRNRLTSVSSGSTTTTYVYDDAGDRVKETTGSTTTYYLIDDANPTGYAKPIEVRVGSVTSTPTNTYIMGSAVIGQASSGAVSYLLVDGQQNTRVLASSSGVVTATFNYDAFGNPIGFAAATAPTIFLFQQTMYDAASGLNFTPSRQERLGASEWMERDSINIAPGDLGNANLYMFVGGNPINLVDPSGHDGGLAELTVEEGIGEELDEESLLSVTPVWVKATAIVTAVGILAAGGLAWTDNGSPETPLSQYLLNVQPLLQQDPTATGQAYNQAVQKAIASGKYTKQQVQNMPVFWVFQSITPDIYNNDVNAMAGKGTKGGQAAPDVLTYLPGGRAINGPGVLQYAASIRMTPTATMWRDEYPFASTSQGGATPWLRLQLVPKDEQEQQRDDLNAFYTANTVPRFGSPFDFLVVPVSR